MTEQTTGVRARITNARVPCPTCGKQVRVKQGGIIGNHGFRRFANGTIDLSSCCPSSGNKYGGRANRVVPCSKCGRPVTTAQESIAVDDDVICPLCESTGSA
jgi:DNA-directed RNA polymerase subunit RPC12/RpoP